MKSRMFEVKARAWVITFAILVTYHLSLIASLAQTFTQQVQQHNVGQGTVTIHHDDNIDRLVNGSAPVAKQNTSATKAPAAPAAKASATPAAKASAAPAAKATAAPAAKAPAASATPTAKATAAPAAKAPAAPAAKASTAPAAKASAAPAAKAPAAKSAAKSSAPAAKSKTRPQTDTTKARPQTDTTHHHPSTAPQETGSTVPADSDSTAIPATSRHGYKTTGYRVQAFAGGNTRRDRQRAEQTGNAMRQLLPGEDVYVRFYSPRWVCRVGNYRTYEEAREKMLLIRKLGYESATIVKGKIIVYHD